MQRLFLAALFFFSILFFPWWFSVFLAVLLVFFDTAYEVLLGGILIDGFYGASLPIFFHLPAFTILFAAFFFIAEFLRPRLRYGKQ